MYRAFGLFFVFLSSLRQHVGRTDAVERGSEDMTRRKKWNATTKGKMKKGTFPAQIKTGINILSLQTMEDSGSDGRQPEEETHQRDRHTRMS